MRTRIIIKISGNQGFQTFQYSNKEITKDKKNDVLTPSSQYLQGSNISVTILHAKYICLQNNYTPLFSVLPVLPLVL